MHPWVKKFWSYKKHLFIWCFLSRYMGVYVQWTSAIMIFLESHWKYMYNVCVFRFELWLRDEGHFWRKWAVSSNCWCVGECAESVGKTSETNFHFFSFHFTQHLLLTSVPPHHPFNSPVSPWGGVPHRLKTSGIRWGEGKIVVLVEYWKTNVSHLMLQVAIDWIHIEPWRA